MRDAGVDQYDFKIGGMPTSNRRYADDTALLTSVEGIERLTTAINVIGKEMNLKLNVKKTKLLVAEGELRKGV